MLKNNRGFSLIEMMIVAGIGIAVMAGFSTMYVHMSKMMKRIDNKQELNALNYDIQAITGSKQTCTNALTPGQIFNFDQADDQSRDADGKIVLDPAAGMNFSFRLSSGEELVSGSKKFLDSYNLKTNLFKLFSAELVGTFGTDTFYKVELVGGFSSQVAGAEIAHAPRTLSHFFLKTDSASNEISECFNLNPNDPMGFAEIKQLICQDFGGTYVDGNCQGLSATSIGECSGGQVMRGVSSADGTPICVAQASGSTTVVNNNTTTTTGGGNKKCAVGEIRQYFGSGGTLTSGRCVCQITKAGPDPRWVCR